MWAMAIVFLLILFGIILANMRKLRNNKIVINDKTRLFIQSLNSNSCNKEYSYHSCISLGDVSIPKVALQKHYISSSDRYNEFDILTTTEGEKQEGSSSLTTKFTSEASILKKYYNSKCSFDMQVHIGECDNASNFSIFDKAIVFKNVVITDYSINSLMASAQADRDVVTESVSFVFDDMIEISLPNLQPISHTAISAGPIIDGFTFCGDTTCSLCEGQTGRYFVQLVECGEECRLVRIIYTLDEGITWNRKDISICEDLSCEQLINTNLVQNTTHYYSLNLSTFNGTSLFQILENSTSIILKSLLYGSKLYQSYTAFGTIFYVGSNGKLFYSINGLIYRLTNTLLSISDNLFSISSLDGYNFVIGSENGKVYLGNIDGEFKVAYLTNGGNVNAIAMISDCSFVASNGENGGFIYTNGKATKMKNIFGAITNFAFYNSDVGYASSHTLAGVYFWQTVDGGRSWQRLSKTLTSNYVVTTLSICGNDHNKISVAGRKMESNVTVEDVLNKELLWNCVGEGFVLLSA